jgi:hypothetical protein
VTKQELAKDKRQKKIFNSSLEQFNADMAAQNNCCAVCERPFVVGANPNKVFTKAFYIPFRDHDHRCCPRRLHIYCGLCNRGLLCYICNKFVVGIMEKHCIPVERLTAYMTKWAGIKPREHPRARAKRKKKK